VLSEKTRNKKRVPRGTQGITEEIKFAEEDLQAG
jgi:hypothetical protein